MNKTIKYINETDIDVMVAAVIKSGKDIKDVAYQVRMSRVEYQTKSQHLEWALKKLLKEKGDK